MREPAAYLLEPNDIDLEVRYLLVGTIKHGGDDDVQKRIAGRNEMILCEIAGRLGEEFRLIRLNGGSINTPSDTASP